MRRHLMSTMQKRNRLQTAMKLTSTANEVGFDAQRNRLRFFATSYSYSKHFIYVFNGRTIFFLIATILQFFVYKRGLDFLPIYSN